MLLTYHIKDKEDKRKKRIQDKKDILFLKINDGLSREQTLGIIDSESCMQGTKRRLRTTLDWCNYQTVSLSIERKFSG